MAEALRATLADPQSQTDARAHRIFRRQHVFVVLWVAQLAAAGVLAPVTTRLLTVRQYGTVGAAAAVALVVYSLADLQWLIALRLRYDADGEGRNRAATFLSAPLGGVATAVVYATGTWWSRALGFGHFDGAPRWALLWGWLMALTAISLGPLRRQERVRRYITLLLVQAVVPQALAIVFAISIHRTASAFVLGLTVGQAIVAAIALACATGGARTKGEGEGFPGKGAYGWPLAASVLGWTALSCSGPLTLLGRLGPQALGRYVVAYGLGSLSLVLLVGGPVRMPGTVWVINQDVEGSTLADRRDATYRLLLPVVVGLSVGGPLLLRIWSPESYEHGGLLLALTLVSLSALLGISSLSSARVLLAGGKAGSLAGGIVAAGAVNIALNLLLVPPWHINGSAAATAVSYGILSLSLKWMADRQMRLRRMSWEQSAVVLLWTVSALGWVYMPTSRAWLAVRGVHAGACLVWFMVVGRDAIAGTRSMPNLRTTLSPGPFAKGGPDGTADDEGRRAEAQETVATPAQPSTLQADEDRAAHSRLRRGLPGGLFDSGFSSLSSFLMGLVATHFLMPSVLGEYAVFYSAFLLAAVVPQTLIFTPIEVLALDMPRTERLSVFRKSVPLGGLAGLVSGIVVCAAVLPIVAKVALTVRVEFIATVVILSCISPVQDHLRRMYHESGRSWIAARLSVIQLAAVAVTIVVARATGIPVALVPFGALAVGNALSVAFGLKAARAPSGPQLQGVPRPWEVIRSGGWLTLGNVSGFACGLLAVSIVAARSGPVANGQAEAARVLSQPVTVIAIGVLAVFGPEIMSAAQRGQVARVNRMMIAFVAVIVGATAFWLLAVGVRWSWSPVGRTFHIAYQVRGLTPWMIVQQSLAYASLSYRMVLVANGLRRSTAYIDVVTSLLIVVAMYVAAPYYGPYSLVWVFLANDVILFGVRGRMAMRSVRAIEARRLVAPDLADQGSQ